MGKALQWLEFWASILPELIRIARALFSDHKGDPEAAIVELREIRKHRTRWDEQRARGDAEMEAMRPEMREAPPPEAEAEERHAEPAELERVEGEGTSGELPDGLRVESDKE